MADIATPADTSATTATETTVATPVEAATSVVATTAPAPRIKRTREQKLLDESKALLAALSSHPQYVDDQNLLTTLQSSIAAEEQVMGSDTSAKAAKLAEIKNVRAEANAAIAKIRSEANAKIARLQAEVDTVKTGSDQAHKNLLKIYNNLYYGAKRIILSNDDVADDAVVKLLK